MISDEPTAWDRGVKEIHKHRFSHREGKRREERREVEKVRLFWTSQTKNEKRPSSSAVRPPKSIFAFCQLRWRQQWGGDLQP